EPTLLRVAQLLLSPLDAVDGPARRNRTALDHRIGTARPAPADPLVASLRRPTAQLAVRPLRAGTDDVPPLAGDLERVARRRAEGRGRLGRVLDVLGLDR